jgi:2,3-bisphosphoglycerate-dependent phosphoglycerate mutase
VDLLLIRHGESEADILGVIEGRADFDLTEKGRAQVRCMAAWIAGRYTIDRVYASPLKRAKQTAEALARETGCAILFDDDLMEGITA